MYVPVLIGKSHLPETGRMGRLRLGPENCITRKLQRDTAPLALDLGRIPPKPSTVDSRAT